MKPDTKGDTIGICIQRVVVCGFSSVPIIFIVKKHGLRC